ncbi:TPA_asm: UL19.5 sORF, partial [Human alphaherpesvirus 1]
TCSIWSAVPRSNAPRTAWTLRASCWMARNWRCAPIPVPSRASPVSRAMASVARLKAAFRARRSIILVM